MSRSDENLADINGSCWYESFESIAYPSVESGHRTDNIWTSPSGVTFYLKDEYLYSMYQVILTTSSKNISKDTK